MPDRFERPLKILCLGLGALLFIQLAFLVWRGDPLAHLTIPALPTLPGETNAAAKPVPKDTNAAGAKVGTAATNGLNSTNVAASTNLQTSTNVASSTNSRNSTNVVVSTNTATSNNVAKSTNAVNSKNLVSTTNSSNSVAGGARRGRGADARGGAPNLPPGMTPEMAANLPPEVMAQMAGGGPPGGPGAGAKKMELPGDVQARVEKIINSELLGPVIHPMPMALIGISDDFAYLRATNVQTGPVKIGKEMGGIKLLKIGVNRVLVEVGGEKQELTMFEGVGGESLMPKTPEAPSTNTAKPSIQNGAANQNSTNQPRAAKPKEIL